MYIEKVNKLVFDPRDAAKIEVQRELRLENGTQWTGLKCKEIAMVLQLLKKILFIIQGEDMKTIL